MDLLRYLWLTGRITSPEYYDIRTRQSVSGLEHELTDEDGFLKQSITQYCETWKLREFPTSEIIRSDRELFDAIESRAGQSFDQLITECFYWHLVNYEPVSSYADDPKFARAIYWQQDEKKMAADYLLSLNGVICNGDTIVIPEGSSALFPAIAIAAHREDVKIITSNSSLIREYHDNPLIARSYKEFHVIGGIADYEKKTRRCEHGGFFGDPANRSYDDAISRVPGATVVIMPVTGLFATQGPYAADGDGRATKRRILESAWDNGVREVIFIADHSKHQTSDRDSGRYHVPLFKEQEWSGLLGRHRTEPMMRVATVPTKRMRRSIVTSTQLDAAHRDLTNLVGHEEFDHADCSYHSSAKELARKLTPGNFHEVLDEWTVKSVHTSPGRVESAEPYLLLEFRSPRADEVKNVISTLLGPEFRDVQTRPNYDGHTVECFGNEDVLARFVHSLENNPQLHQLILENLGPCSVRDEAGKVSIQITPNALKVGKSQTDFPSSQGTSDT